MRKPDEVTQDEYVAFYKALSNDWEEPLLSSTFPLRDNLNSRPFCSAPSVLHLTCSREATRRNSTTSNCTSDVYSSWTTARISCLNGSLLSRELWTLRIFLLTFLVKLCNKTRFFASSRRTLSRSASRCLMI